MRQNGSIVGPYIEPTLGPASGVHSLSRQGSRQGGNVWPLNVASLPYTTNLFAHFDASDGATIFDSNSGGSQTTNGGVVGRWEDKSGNGRHLLQSTNNNRPLLRTNNRNGLNGIEFDGSNDNLLFTSSLSNPMSICFVARKTKVGSDVQFTEDDNVNAYFNYAVSGGFTTTWATTGNTRPYINGVDVKGASGPQNAGDVYFTTYLKTYAIVLTGLNLGTWSGLRLAGYTALDWGGIFYEVIIYNETLSTTNVRNISRYLRSKWGTGTGFELL